MPSLSLKRMKSLGRPRLEEAPKAIPVAEHIEQVTISPVESNAMATTMTEEPPLYELPSYTEAVAGDDQIAELPPPRRRSSPVPSLAPSYRQSHAPPVYQPRLTSERNLPVRQPVDQRRASQSSLSPFKRQAQAFIAEAQREAQISSNLQTPLQKLCQAALEGRLPTVQTLLEEGTDVYEVSKTGKITSAIHDALRGPNPGVALLLLHYPCDQGKMFGSLVPPISPEETEARLQARLKFLLAMKDKKGCTPLHLAASAGAADVAREMLELGASVNAQDDFHRTPLLMAAKFARSETLEVLLEYGADPGLVRQKVWEIAGPERKEELGDFDFVRRVVNRAVQRRQSGGMDEKGLMDDEDTLRNFGWTRDSEGDQTARTQPSRRRSKYDEDEDDELERFKRSVRGTSLASFAPPVPAVAGPSLEGGPLRPGPRLQFRTESLRFQPEFSRWKSMCDTVQEEHRRQKDRNLAEGSGSGGLVMLE